MPQDRRRFFEDYPCSRRCTTTASATEESCGSKTHTEDLRYCERSCRRTKHVRRQGLIRISCVNSSLMVIHNERLEKISGCTSSLVIELGHKVAKKLLEKSFSSKVRISPKSGLSFLELEQKPHAESFSRSWSTWQLSACEWFKASFAH